MSRPLAAGTRLGAWTLEQPLGAGGSGTVYRARRGQRGAVRALKVLPMSEGAAAAARFRREATRVKSVRHPGIARLIDAFVDGDLAVLVSELVPGRSLDRWLAAGRPLSPARTLSIARDLAGALAHLHARSLVHRDVKPSNVVAPESGRARLIDFGLVRRADERTLVTRGRSVRASLAYAAPEVLLRQAVGPAADLYALGALLAELLTGRLAFAGASAAAVVTAHLAAPPPRPSAELPGVSPWWDRVIAKLLEKEPAQRYADAASLAEDLDALAGELSAAGGLTPARAGTSRARDPAG